MIPVSKPYLTDLDRKYLLEAFDSSMLTWHGEFVPKFESKFQEFIGTKYSLSCSNGTTALHLCLLALGITNGDEVITTDLSYASTAFAISYCGAKPVFVDIADDWNIDPNKIEDKITSKTKVILVVHLYGHACDMPTITRIAKKYSLFIVEDCAEALGAYSGSSLTTCKVGSIGDINAFSFFGNKIITTGEGGMVTTNNPDLYEKAKFYCRQAQSSIQYFHTEVGYNYRMTNLQAAIGLSQLEKIDLMLSRRRVIRDKYNKNLVGVGLKLMPSKEFDVNWLYSLEVYRRDELIEKLRRNGIESRPFFYPLHKLPMYSTSEEFLESEKASKNGINLPTFCDLTFDEIDEISLIVRKHAKLYHS